MFPEETPKRDQRSQTKHFRDSQMQKQQQSVVPGIVKNQGK